MYLGRAAPASHDDSTLMPMPRQVPPNSIDWRTRGVVTGVQNQVCSCMCPILHLTLFYKFREAVILVGHLLRVVLWKDSMPFQEDENTLCLFQSNN